MMESCSAIKKQKEEHNTDGFQKPWAVRKKPGVKEHTLDSSLPHFKLQELSTLLPCLTPMKSNFSHSLLQTQWGQLHSSSYSRQNSPSVIGSSCPHTSALQSTRTSCRFHLQTHPICKHFRRPPPPSSSP